MESDLSGTLKIASEGDILRARKIARESSTQLGFGVTDITRIVTAVSELARNVFHYAGSGTMRWQVVDSGRRTGLELVFTDNGPGIADIDEAMQVGFTTSQSASLGMGLPGAKRLMDEMNIQSVMGEGTTVVVRKWRRPSRR